jgi:hypothetical protein
MLRVLKKCSLKSSKRINSLILVPDFTVDQKLTVCYNSYTVNKQPKEGTMKKILISAVAIATLAASSVATAQGYNRGHNQGYNNSAAWNSAAIGAAGMITGAIVSGIMQNNANAAAQGYAQPGYAPGYGYAPPPVVYYQQPACVTSRAPVYDRFGRVTEFVQYCANSVR